MALKECPVRKVISVLRVSLGLRVQVVKTAEMEILRLFTVVPKL